MDAETWGKFETLAHPPYVFGECSSLCVEVLCTGGSVLGRNIENRHLSAVNDLADALSLPRAVVQNLHVERVAGDRDPAAVLESDVGAKACEMPENARPRDILEVEDDRGCRQVQVPDGARPGSVFVAPRLIDGARVDVDVVAVKVPAGFHGGDVLSVNAVGGRVDAVVPNGAKQGQTFMQEYHPRRTHSPEFRVTFQIHQPRYTIDGWDMGTGAAQYPLHAMENEMKYRLNTRGCGLVTHISIESAESSGEWEACDKATLRLWNAAESGDLQTVCQVLKQLKAAGLLSRDRAGGAGVVNKQGPVSGSTALHLAARWGHVEIIMELLLRGRADSSKVDGNGRTAEEVAAEYGRRRATKVLADWRIENPTGGGTTAGYPGVGSEAYHDQSPEQNMMLYAEEQSSRLSASELNMQRGRELQDWKEQRVNEAVALIRAMQCEAPPQALQFEPPSEEDKVPRPDGEDFVLFPTPIREPWPNLDRVGIHMMT